MRGQRSNVFVLIDEAAYDVILSMSVSKKEGSSYPWFEGYWEEVVGKTLGNLPT